MLFMNSLKCKW